MVNYYYFLVCFYAYCLAKLAFFYIDPKLFNSFFLTKRIIVKIVSKRDIIVHSYIYINRKIKRGWGYWSPLKVVNR